MALYTPFMKQGGAAIGGAIANRGQNKMAGDAYMGKPGAMEKLMQFNPKMGIEIQKQQQADEQKKLESAATKQKEMQALYADNKELFDGALENAAKFDSYEEAYSYLENEKESFRGIVGDVVDSFEFTPEMFSNIKQVHGDEKGGAFEGSGMPAQVSSALVKGADDPAFRETAEYARAWDVANKPQIIDTEEGRIPLYPEISSMFKPPGKPKTEAQEVAEIKSAVKSDSKVIEGTEKTKTTADEKLSVGFYNRMIKDEKNIADLGDFDSTAVWEQFKGLTNISASEDLQQYRQAADDWIRAKLRRESGAVIAQEEMDKEYEIYFPQIGDGQKVIDQKKGARKEAVRAMKIASGRALKNNKVVEKPKAAESSIDDQAFKWAKDNPGDPRSKKILKKLGK